MADTPRGTLAVWALLRGRRRAAAGGRPRAVGVTGFEPVAPRSQSECATKLRHTPWAQLRPSCHAVVAARAPTTSARDPPTAIGTGLSGGVGRGCPAGAGRTLVTRRLDAGGGGPVVASDRVGVRRARPGRPARRRLGDGDGPPRRERVPGGERRHHGLGRTTSGRLWISARAPSGRSSMVEPQSSKLATRVRFPSPAPTVCAV